MEILKIRGYPYPYLAALSFSNDIDCTNFRFFDELMRYLNTDDNTILGKGLKIPVSSSCFFYTRDPSGFSYFKNDTFTKSSCASRMEHYLKFGYFDAIHSYGNFDIHGGFRREHASFALSLLRDLGVDISVYTNHGDAHNIQNMGGESKYHQGDMPRSAAYHADLTVPFGIRFLWSDGCIWETLKPSILQKCKSMAKGTFQKPFALFKEDRLRDGQQIKKFYRYRGTGKYAPNLQNMQDQLTDAFLGDIVNRGEKLVIYQHLGVLSKNQDECITATLDQKDQVIAMLGPLRTIASKCHNGEIWVESLQNFLNYFHIKEHLQVFFENNAIVIKSSVPIKTPQKELQYVTVYLGPDQLRGPLQITCNQKSLLYIRNGPDRTGNCSITITPQDQVNIWR
jgi:hypothetical protein